MNSNERVAIKELQVKMDGVKEKLDEYCELSNKRLNAHSVELTKLGKFKSKQDVINIILGFVSGAAFVAVLRMLLNRGA